MRQPRLTNLDHVRDAFMQGEKPYWVLYSGIVPKKQGAITLASNNTITSVEDAFDLLQENIKRQSQPGVRFTIFVTAQPKGQKGHNLGYNLFYEVAKDTPGIAGASIAGPNHIAQEMGYNSGVQMAVQMALLQRDLEDHKRMIDAKNEPQNFIGQAFEAIRDQPEILQHVAGFIATIKQALSSVPPAVQVQTVNGPDPENTFTGFTPEAMQAIEEIHQQADLNELLPKLAKAFRERPDDVNLVLNML